MLPIIDKLLCMRNDAGNPLVSQNMTQIIIPNFTALATLIYNVAPSSLIKNQIFYEIGFGQAMVPHSFDVKMYHSSTKVFDAVVSGRFTTGVLDIFAWVDPEHPLQVYVTNLRNITNYYESFIFFLDVQPGEGADRVKAFLDDYQSIKTATGGRR